MLNAVITSNYNSNEWTKKFPKDLSVADLRNKLILISGANESSMQIKFLDLTDKVICDDPNQFDTIGKYAYDNENIKIMVMDNTLKKGEYEDVSHIQKFVLTEEEYSKIPDTFRNFAKQHGLENPHESNSPASILNFKIGDRCQVAVIGQPHKRGTIRFLGETHFKPGPWVGVECDEPLGKNDGSIEGKRYFTCAPKYGVFVRPESIETGDFPPEDESFEDLAL